MVSLGTAVLSLSTDDSALRRGLSGAQNLALGAAAGIGAALAGIGAAVIKTGFDFDSMKQQALIGFETMLGGAKQAQDFMADLSAFAASTPFELTGLIKSSQKLLAFGFAAQDVKPMLTAIGDAVSGLGGGSAEIDRVTMALGQMKAKGKVSAEEMMQLAELGIPAWDMLAKTIGVDVGTAMDMASKGAIKADVAINGLVAGMSDKFGGLMAKQSRSWAGLWSTIQDTAMQTAGKLAGPFFEKASAGLAVFTDFLGSETVTAGIDAITVSLESIMGLLSESDPEKRIEFFNTLALYVGGDTAEKIALITSGLIGLFGVLTGSADGAERVKNALVGLVGSDIADFIMGVGAAIGGVLGPIADAVSQFVSWQDVAVAVGILLASVLIPAIVALVASLWPVIAVFAGITLAVAVLRTAWENDFLGIKTTLTEFWEQTASPLLGQLGTWLQENIPVAVAAAKGAFDELVKFWQAYVVPSLETMIKNFQTLATIVGQVASGDFGGALGTFQNRFTRLQQGNGMAGYAGGTPYATPGWHTVGENGPELMKFRGGETVIPNAHLSGASAVTGGNSFDMSTTINGSGLSRAEQEAMLEQHRRKQVSDLSRVLAGTY